MPTREKLLKLQHNYKPACQYSPLDKQVFKPTLPPCTSACSKETKTDQLTKVLPLDSCKTAWETKPQQSTTPVGLQPKGKPLIKC